MPTSINELLRSQGPMLRAGTVADVDDATQGNALLQGEETDAFGDAGYQGMARRDDAGTTHWHVAMRPGKRRALDLGRAF